ncbi:MAG: hypothetical protein ACHQVK_02380, partial [Candidatus Paceibacterales bacterium]
YHNRAERPPFVSHFSKKQRFFKNGLQTDGVRGPLAPSGLEGDSPLSLFSTQHFQLHRVVLILKFLV